jgi:hypothetical protein
MAKTIFKYVVPHATKTVIKLPKFGNVVHVEAQDSKPCMWVMQEEEPKNLIDREFGLFVTGGTLPEEPMQFLGTVLLDHGAYVLHLFEYLNSRR